MPQKTFTVSSVAGGGSSTQDVTGLGASAIYIKRINVVPNLAGDSYQVQLYRTDAFADLNYDSGAVTGTHEDPIESDDGAETQHGQPTLIICVAEDEDASGELHVKVTNNDGAARDFDFIVDYDIPVLAATTGNITLLDSQNLILGTGGDATLKYNGSNVILNPRVVGTGQFYVQSGVIINDNALDSDTRIESTGNINMFFVDALTNRVGIGTSTPGRTFSVNINDAVAYVPATFSTSGIRVENAAQLDGSTVGIHFLVRNTAGSFGSAGIDAVAVSGGQNADLVFRTRNESIVGEVFRATYDNKVGIGTASPTSLLELQGGLATAGSILTLGTKEPTVVVNDILGRINFYAPLELSGTDAILVGASIAAIAEQEFQASRNSTSLIFQTGFSELATTKATLNSGGNFGLGIDSWGSSAAKVLGIGTGTPPGSGVADSIQLYSLDLSAGNTMLGLYTEGTPIGSGTPTADRTMAIKVNGTTYYVLLSTIP